MGFFVDFFGNEAEWGAPGPCYMGDFGMPGEANAKRWAKKTRRAFLGQEREAKGTTNVGEGQKWRGKWQIAKQNNAWIFGCGMREKGWMG